MGATAVTPVKHDSPEFLILRDARVTWPQVVAEKDRPEPIQLTTGVPAPKWLDDTFERVNRLTTLQEDWDGYGASRVSGNAAINAIRFLVKIAYPKLAPPEVVPVADGGLQVEWHRDGLDFEVMFEPDAPASALIEDRAKGTEAETVEGDDAVNALNRFVGRLSVR